MCLIMEELREESAREAKIEIAQKMLNTGKMSYEEISDFVDLPVEEIKALDTQKSAWYPIRKRASAYPTEESGRFLLRSASFYEIFLRSFCKIFWNLLVHIDSKKKKSVEHFM